MADVVQLGMEIVEDDESEVRVLCESRKNVADIVLLAMEIVEDDESDDEFDAELEAAFALAVCKLLRADRNRVSGYFQNVTSRYFDFEFKKLFRLSRETCDLVCERFRRSSSYPKAVSGRRKISAEETILIALSYIGNQSSMNSVADRFDVTESSVVLCLRRVLDFLMDISDEVIAWPDDAELACSKARFLSESGGKGPRNTVGCIDGSHVEIAKPEDSTASYINRKKWPSIILQGICNDQNKFLDVFIGFPGSAHDARVLKESPFFAEATSKCGDDYILGDSAYPLLPWLLTPYRDNGSSFPSWKKKFNKYHSQQRVAIENTFGLVKQRFRRLYLIDAKSILQCCKIVMGACVLHNLCNAERDFIAELADNPHIDDVGNNDEDIGITSPACSDSRRQMIAQHQC
ncbi:hypothetical protein V5799_007934 [Amblyomma americanum]|uniref:DDE Tnp4 domain-containing protein n=1 Tax=Amblyomma americanum TaxID=6943 RepID=A0AAQ4FEP8_AMBAM